MVKKGQALLDAHIDLLRSTTPLVLPYSRRPRHCSVSSVKDKVDYNILEVPLLPDLPASTIEAAQADKTNDIVQGDVQHVEEFHILRARDRSQFRIFAKDADATEFLAEVGKEQHSVSKALDSGPILAGSDGQSDAGSSMGYSRKCPVTTCEYHHKGFSLIAERDKHTMTHAKGYLRCGFQECRSTRDDLGNTKDNGQRYDSAEHLRNHVLEVHKYQYTDMNCSLCCFDRDWVNYDLHLDGCIIHAVELQASEKAQACPVSSCDYHYKTFASMGLASKHHRSQHMMQHYLTLLSCGWCPKERRTYSVYELKRHVAEEHWLDLSRVDCPICCRVSLSVQQFFKHLDACIILQIQKRARVALPASETPGTHLTLKSKAAGRIPNPLSHLALF